MSMNFEFATATEIVFGWGTLEQLGRRVQALGRRALVLTGSHSARAQAAISQLAKVNIASYTYSICSEPTVEGVQQGVELARAQAVDFIIGFGGGSAIDAAKAIAALANNPGSVLQYLEVIGDAKPLTCPSLPCVAIPTTAGTGSEVTKNAVLRAVEHKVKVSLRGLNLLPRLALIDPSLTVSVPPAVTAATGLDALTQVIEPFLSVARGPLTDALCLQGMRLATRSLRRAYADGSDRQAREDLAVTSLFGGLALANAKLGAVHGLAAPLGGLFEAPHGAICARLLPLVLRANHEAAQKSGDRDLLARFDEVARVLAADTRATGHDAIGYVKRLVDDFSIPRLQHYGMTQHHIASIVEKCRDSSSMKGNPVSLGVEDLSLILAEAL